MASVNSLNASFYNKNISSYHDILMRFSEKVLPKSPWYKIGHFSPVLIFANICP
jgi:hypothetical protein